jgi:hypothetical protein
MSDEEEEHPNSAILLKNSPIAKSPKKSPTMPTHVKKKSINSIHIERSKKLALQMEISKNEKEKET